MYNIFACVLSADENECTADPNLCANGVCVNTDGAFTCNCSTPGYTFATNDQGKPSCVGKWVRAGLRNGY